MHRWLITAALIGPSSTAAADAWQIDVDARVGATLELDAGAPADGAGVLPVLAVGAGRRLGAATLRLRASLGLPLGNGQLGLMAGLERAVAVGRRDGWDVELSATALAGVATSFLDAAPEIQYADGAQMWWGPLARLELGVRAWAPRAPGATAQLGVYASVGGEGGPASYLEPEPGRGWRAAIDLGVGGAVSF